jgi:hypothetical protein
MLSFSTEQHAIEGSKVRLRLLNMGMAGSREPDQREGSQRVRRISSSMRALNASMPLGMPGLIHQSGECLVWRIIDASSSLRALNGGIHRAAADGKRIVAGRPGEL